MLQVYKFSSVSKIDSKAPFEKLFEIVWRYIALHYYRGSSKPVLTTETISGCPT